MFITPNHTGDYCFISKELKVPNFHVAHTGLIYVFVDQINFLFFSIENVPRTFNYFTMRRTNGNERFRTDSKLHLTAVLRLRNKKKVDDIKVVFMKNSYLDMSMLSKRSPKADLFGTHLLSIL